MRDVPPGAAGGFQNLPVSSAAVGFTASNYIDGPAIAGYARGVVETNTIRWRCDGTDPTTTVGVIATAGTVIELNTPADIQRFRAIAAAADGAIQILFHRLDPRG